MSEYEAICIHVGKEYVFIHPQEILYVKSDGNYVHLYTIDEKTYMISRKLKDVEDSLPSELFLRVHNTFIVNLSYVVKYRGDDKCEIILDDGTAIPLSRRRKSDFLSRFTRL